MAAMTWIDSYSVGIAEIDRQHKKLIDLINQLDTAMSKGRGKEATGKILGDLVRYCASHFAMEEKLFDRYEYPEADEHKAKHKKMTDKVLSLHNQLKAGKIAISIDVMNFLQKWLDNHILGTDKKYGPYLNSKGVN